jgi:hypothetical protein
MEKIGNFALQRAKNDHSFKDVVHKNLIEVIFYLQGT